MNKFINPFSDFGWKKIFGSEVSKDLIISFLNEVIQQEVIVDITFRNVEMLGLKQDQRRAVFEDHPGKLWRKQKIIIFAQWKQVTNYSYPKAY